MPDIEKTEFTFPDEQGVEVASAAAAPEVELEVVDDTPLADQNRPPMTEAPKEPTEEEMASYSESVQQRFRHFTRGFHEERRAKEAAQREKEEALRLAQAVVEENNKLKGSLSYNQNALLEQAKRSVAAEIEDAKRKYKEALESFDNEATVTAQQALFAAQLKADKVNNFRAPPLQQPKTDVQTALQQQAPAIDPKTLAWRDKNQWFGTDRKKTAYAIGVHEELDEKGIQVGSDEYFRLLDKDLSERFPDLAAATVDANPQRASTNVVAPATRSTAPKKIVLSKTQVSIAKRLGVPLELYARKVAEEMRK